MTSPVVAAALADTDASIRAADIFNYDGLPKRTPHLFATIRPIVSAVENVVAYSGTLGIRLKF